jgi:uncharacterized membrane-anchored protein
MNTLSTTEEQTKQQIFLKVPAILAIFWIVKLLTTGMGEAFADFLQFSSQGAQSGMMTGVPQMGTGGPQAIAAGGLPELNMISIIAILGLAAALALQFHTKKYVAWIYWLAVSMVSITGTILADTLQRSLGGTFNASLIFAAILAAIFAVWYLSEKTLSIHSIYTKRREAFYWAVVIVAFTLGTALGDWTADSLGLGYLGSIVLFGILFAVPFVAHRFGLLNGIAAFWFAYIMTRPFGASVADWLDSGTFRGGLGFGTLPVSIVAIILIAGLVAYLSYTRIDVPKDVVEEEKGREPAAHPPVSG